MAPSNLGRSALWYARHGWRVFPVVPRKKLPLIKGWPQLATTDLEQVARWWRQEPEANIGLACGPDSGLYVIDVDRHGEVDGEAALATLEHELGAPAVHRRAAHRLGRATAPVGVARRPRAAQQGRQAVDRTHRRVPAPARHRHPRARAASSSSRPRSTPAATLYRWTNGPHQSDPTHLPERWIKALERKKFTMSVPITPFKVVCDPDAMDRLAAHVAGQGRGNRNSALYWAARKLQQLRVLGLVRDDGDDRPLIAAAVHAGLDEREARATVASARRAGGAQ
jgi:hypothetical protein